MKYLVYNTLIILFTFQLLGCGDGTKPNTKIQTGTVADSYIKITRNQFDQNSMALGSLQETEFPILVKATGMIDVPPENRSVISATLGGYVKTLPLLIGDGVRKGQALLTIENPEFVTLQQDYMEVSGQLDYLKSEYDRQKTMIGENITSQKSYLKAESEYKTANARFNGLQKKLVMLNISPANVESGTITSVTTIYAPISGSITKVNVAKGSYVTPDTPILEIIDNDHIHLELAVFEKDIMTIKKGQHITFRIPEASPDNFDANVHLVGTSIGEGRTIKVHGHLNDEEKNNFLTGMFVEASIITDAISAKSLPSESVVNVGDHDYVLVLEKEEEGDYYFKQFEVTVLDSYGGFSRLDKISAFKPTDRFLTKGAFNLLTE